MRFDQQKIVDLQKHHNISLHFSDWAEKSAVPKKCKTCWCAAPFHKEYFEEEKIKLFFINCSHSTFTISSSLMWFTIKSHYTIFKWKQYCRLVIFSSSNSAKWGPESPLQQIQQSNTFTNRECSKPYDRDSYYCIIRFLDNYYGQFEITLLFR